MTRARQKTIKIVLVINVLRKERRCSESVHEVAMSGSRASILRQIKNDVNFGEMKISGTFVAVIGFTTRFIVCE